MPQPGNNIMRYAGMATQFLVAIGVAVFIGLQLDKCLNWRIPIWIWVLPLLVIIAMIIGVIRDSSKK